MSKARDRAFSNRARSCEVTDNCCERCYEPLIFALKGKEGEFSVGLITILDCLKLAQQNGYVPKLPDGWWLQIEQQYK